MAPAVASSPFIPIGREWVTGSNLDHFLISRINPIRNELDSLHGEDGCVNFHWAQPIHAQEAAFHERHGVSELEEAFEKASTNILALTRGSGRPLRSALESSPASWSSCAPASNHARHGIAFDAGYSARTRPSLLLTREQWWANFSLLVGDSHSQHTVCGEPARMAISAASFAHRGDRSPASGLETAPMSAIFGGAPPQKPPEAPWMPWPATAHWLRSERH